MNQKNTTIISSKVTLDGDVVMTGDLVVEGIINGNVFNNGIITIKGTINGSVNAMAVIVEKGTVNGDVTSDNYVKNNGGIIKGDVKCNDIELHGKCLGNVNVRNIANIYVNGIIYKDLTSSVVNIENNNSIKGLVYLKYNI